VPVVILLLLAAGAILGGVIVVAMGHGGEMARYRAPRPVSSDFRNWKDVAGYRPPAALLGYHASTTEQALLMIARVVAERDAEISWLRAKLAELQPERPSQTWQGGAREPDTASAGGWPEAERPIAWAAGAQPVPDRLGSAAVEADGAGNAELADAEAGSGEDGNAQGAVEESDLAAETDDHEAGNGMPAAGHPAGAASAPRAGHTNQPGDRT
jgi:hypothetical protein